MKVICKIAFLAIIATVAFASCDRTEPSAPLDLPVIEGWIDSEGYPVVLFSKTLMPTGSGNLADNIIKWGKVTISDGENTVVLTGGPSDDYFPPYRYYTQAMQGEAGKTYTITAEYKGYRASASSTLLPATPIEDISVNTVEGIDTVRALSLSFTSPEDCPAYYYVTIRDRSRHGRAYPASLGAIEAREPHVRINLPLLMPKVGIDTLTYRPNFPIGRRYMVELCRIGRAEYDFWHTYEDLTMFGNTSLINSSVELTGNIIGGFGIWCARGVCRRVVTLDSTTVETR